MARTRARMGKVERDVEGVVVGCHRTEVINRAGKHACCHTDAPHSMSMQINFFPPNYGSYSLIYLQREMPLSKHPRVTRHIKYELTT
jgi:hypothetical protein